MLGYVRVFKPEMKIKDYALYKGVYCALCRSLGRNYSPAARLFLSYDFAFAAILRLAVRDKGCVFSKKRLPCNPAKKSLVCVENGEIDYCARALIITSYYKTADDLRDAGFGTRLAAALVYPIIRLMRRKAARLSPELDATIGSAVKKQAEIEKKGNVGLDEAAEPSARALGKAISAGFEGVKKDGLYSLGYMIGRYVYILDAADDLEGDLKTGRFNPFSEKYPTVADGKRREEFVGEIRATLNLTQSAALDALDSLEKKRFGSILENVVFDGLTRRAEEILNGYSSGKPDLNSFTVD